DGRRLAGPVEAARRRCAQGTRGQPDRPRTHRPRSPRPPRAVITRLVSLGSVIIDLVLSLPGLPKRGGDVLAAQRGIAVGGAFNVLSAASRLGLSSVYAGPHGRGPFGDLVRAALCREGIEIARAPNPDLDTGWTIALIEPDAERTFITVTGADAIVEPADLEDIEYRAGDAVYVSGYDLAYPASGAA